MQVLRMRLNKNRQAAGTAAMGCPYRVAGVR
ncbi:hypothetical protein Pvag_pPag30153 (plasmid) [Pantoea vagans C9-1]|nr:hypothetical protein Pvag_pPag30153 [Pantoea vagans C9-1]